MLKRKVSGRLVAAGLILAFALISPGSLLFVPFAVAMVYADQIVARWADRKGRIYSIGDLVVAEGILLALLCVFLWLLTLIGAPVKMNEAVWAIIGFAALRAGLGVISAKK